MTAPHRATATLPRSILLVTFIAVAACSIGAIFARASVGPIERPIAIHSPMNLEGVFALALLALALAYSREPATANVPNDNTRTALFTLLCLGIVAFGPFLSFPLLADDYDHIWNARQISVPAIWSHFTRPESDRFFRPLVYLCYGLEARIAGLHAAAWRGLSLGWHVVSALFCFGLLRSLKCGAFAAFAGAALFLVHGTRPEAVTWVAAQFDLLATAFGLAALWLLLRGQDWLAAPLLLLALLSKESAYVLPLLASALLIYAREPWRSVLRRLALWYAIALTVFLYRLSVLGEIGGYHNAGNGRPTIFNIRFTTTLKGFFLRAWAAALVPLNWTYRPSFLVAALLLASLFAMVWLVRRGADRRMLCLGIAFFWIAALPVHQFLSIGDDLEKSRVLYLPSIGLAIVFASLLKHNGTAVTQAAAVLVLLFHVAALEHNLVVWRDVGNLARNTCDDVLERLESSPRQVSVPDLPNVVDGVYFLKTGFPACVWLQDPSDKGRVTAQALPDALTLRWDTSKRALVTAAP